MHRLLRAQGRVDVGGSDVETLRSHAAEGSRDYREAKSIVEAIHIGQCGPKITNALGRNV